MIHFCFSLIQNLAVFFNSFLSKFDRNERKNGKLLKHERNKTFKIVCEGE